jgi:hypothetical protein
LDAHPIPIAIQTKSAASQHLREPAVANRTMLHLDRKVRPQIRLVDRFQNTWIRLD